MNILRTLGLSFGALFSAACLFAQFDPTEKYKIPNRYQIHKHYVKASTSTLHLAMSGLEEIVTWECYVDSGQDSGSRKPKYRTSAWLVGKLKFFPASSTPPALNLFDIGAQHRTHKILVRVITDNVDAAPKIMQTRRGGADLSPAEEARKVRVKDEQALKNDFYLLETASWNPMTLQLANAYELTPPAGQAVRLEVIFWDHPPGKHAAQDEDGGPPSNPPVQQN